MMDATANIDWEIKAKTKYDEMIKKMPLFHREIAKIVVDKKAVINAQDRGSETVEESDILRAFFSEVPMTFYSLMVRLFDEVSFDYKQLRPVLYKSLHTSRYYLKPFPYRNDSLKYYLTAHHFESSK